MALFCARYLTSSPFAVGLSGNEIARHAMTGYYGFQDYAAAFWWKHARRVIDEAADIEEGLYLRTLQAVSKAMMEYGDCKDKLPPDPNKPDTVQGILVDFATDAREWENSFKIELRTREIRNRIEALLGEEDTSETNDSILMLYGPVTYKCYKPWCQAFSNGFKEREDRHRHLLKHDRPFRCSMEGCYGNEIGFSSEVDLGEHNEKFHLKKSTVHFPSPRLFTPSSKALLEAAKKGNLAQVRACLSAGIPIHGLRTRRAPLHLAVENNHLQVCQHLLEHGADINFRSDMSDTVLFAAVGADNAELTHFLLSQPQIDPGVHDAGGFTAAGLAAHHGFNKSLSVFISKGLASRPNQGMSRNHTCLDIALECGNLQAAELINDASLDLSKDSGLDFLLHRVSRSGFVAGVKSILSGGRININAFDSFGRRALHYACEAGHDSVVELLAPHVNDLGIKDYSGRTAIQYAAEGNHTAIVNLLLKRGVDPNSTDHNNKPLVLWAIESRRAELVTLLLEKGADTNLDDDGQTVLLSAALKGNVEVVKLVIERGADPDSKNKSDWTPLMCAADGGHMEVVKLLLLQGADPDWKDESGWTPLTWAADRGHVEVVKQLLLQGADPDSKNESGWTPLTWAAYCGHVEVIKQLLLQGADPDSKNESGWTPLMCAASSGHVEVVKQLLLRGADPDLKNESSWTPLMCAASNGHVEVVKQLLLRGADLNSKGENGRMLLTWAASGGHVEVVKQLLQSGANPNCQDSSGLTPLYWATIKGEREIVELLAAAGAKET